MRVGFVNILGFPNAGKSTLLNALMGEKLAIVSSKVQTTRHRIKGILSTADYQIVISDTPGIIEPQYKLHERMMGAVRSALEDGDLAILLVDLKQDWKRSDQLFSSLRLKVPAIVVLNKKDLVGKDKLQEAMLYFSKKPYCKKVVAISAKNEKTSFLLQELLPFLPEGNPFFDSDQISDLQTRFFVGEIIRGKIFDTMEEEIPYHTAVMVREFKEKPGLVRILADIIVNRETQKGIILGQQGATIKKIGSEARKDIEAFLQEKVYLELFVKVRPRWRDNELFLNEYGY
ncbi:MAG: GTPase Era [Bacteroidetes bacterium]|nr:GTPase Era [Bacteroidota bacterium]